jgi:catechol 2,3-dioxygenase-like lactoylglutathione lyase family enzyme
MINLHDIRYARLGTQDMDPAIKFATNVVGLQLVAREGNAAYFRNDKTDVRGDTRDHTVVYFEGDPADQTIGLDLIDPGDLDTVGGSPGKGRATGSLRYALGMRQPAHPGVHRVRCGDHQFQPCRSIQH